MRIIDAHHHLWDPTALDYAVLVAAKRLAPVLRACLAADFDRIARANGVDAAIAVEAASAGAEPQAETTWLLREAARSALTKRVVVYAPVESAGIGAHLDIVLQRGGGRIAGVRRSFENVGDGFMLSDAVVEGIRQVGARGLPFDLVLFGDRLAEAVLLARCLPQVSFVLDHLGKPAIGRTVPQHWIDGIAALAQLPNVTAKISGLVSEDGGSDMRRLRPYIDHAVAVFGWHRLMFGSDWPICEIAGGYAAWLAFMKEIAARASPAEQAAFFAGTAEQVYGTL